jgi:hypothetical protein
LGPSCGNESPKSPIRRGHRENSDREAGINFPVRRVFLRNVRECQGVLKKGVLRKDLIFKLRLVYDVKASKSNLNDVNPS